MNYQSAVKRSGRVLYVILAAGVLAMAGLSANRETVKKDLNDPELIGLWESNCYAFEEGIYQVRTFEFVLSHLVTVITQSYDDAGCNGHMTEVSELSATWDVGQSLRTGEGVNAYQLDVLMRLNPRQDLVTIRQIVHVDEHQMVLGITSNDLQSYPAELDWELVYRRKPASHEIN